MFGWISMESTFPSKRRENLIISVAILKAARRGIRKTILMRQVSLSYEQFKKYITFLKACGFVEEIDAFYKTTEKGVKLIEEFESSPLIRSVLSA